MVLSFISPTHVRSMTFVCHHTIIYTSSPVVTMEPPGAVIYKNQCSMRSVTHFFSSKGMLSILHIFLCHVENHGEMECLLYLDPPPTEKNAKTCHNSKKFSALRPPKIRKLKNWYFSSPKFFTGIALAGF